MLRTRRAAQILATAILVWLAATVLVAVWLLSALLPDPSSHAAGDAILGMVILSPQLVVALIGLAALNALRTDSRRAPRWGLAWGVLQIVVGLVMAWRCVSLLASVITEGRRIAWDAGESAVVFTTGGMADYTHWGDWTGLVMLAVAVIGAAAALRLERTTGRDSATPPQVTAGTDVRVGRAGRSGAARVGGGTSRATRSGTPPRRRS